MPSVHPFLWFDCDLAEVVAHYRSVFPDATVDGVPDDGSPVFSATLHVHGQTLLLLNGGPFHAGFTEAISMFVGVDTQEEIDVLWQRFVDGGGEAGQCGWLKDRYGLSWQIIPNVLGELLGHPDRARAGRAHEAMLQMGKLDVAALRAAFDR